MLTVLTACATVPPPVRPIGLRDPQRENCARGFAADVLLRLASVGRDAGADQALVRSAIEACYRGTIAGLGVAISLENFILAFHRAVSRATTSSVSTLAPDDAAQRSRQRIEADERQYAETTRVGREYVRCMIRNAEALAKSSSEPAATIAEAAGARCPAPSDPALRAAIDSAARPALLETVLQARTSP
jgi:hypothetical protein